MARQPDPARAPRVTARLSQEAIVVAAIAIADREGLDAVSMRRLGQDLEANPMSLYHHVRDKDALLNAMADSVVRGIAPARDTGSDGWIGQMRSLIHGARRALLRHPWVVTVLQQQASPTEATLGHIERVLAILRGGGCSVRLTHHALHVLGSRVLGFSQDLFDDSVDSQADPTEVAAELRHLADTYPHVVELAAAVTHDGGLGGCDDDEEFDFALDLLLEGIERRRVLETRADDA